MTLASGVDVIMQYIGLYSIAYKRIWGTLQQVQIVTVNQSPPPVRMQIELFVAISLLTTYD